MISDIYSALMLNLSGGTIRYIDNAEDIAWENSDFNPLGKSAWLQETLLTNLSSTEAKDFVGLVDDGIYQIDVFVPLNDIQNDVKQYNLRALDIESDINNLFRPNTFLTFNDAKVQITELSRSVNPVSGAWYQISISITYVRI